MTVARPFTIQDLQTLSAEAIQALPHAIPIQDGDETVGFLMPAPPKSRLREALEFIDEEVAKQSPEQKAAIDRLLAERGID